ncbi:MAG: hypothetical protein J6Y94_00550, partial [Bacteriovoracaceae bacterium]|nr:hypothetical protein [Bacteriovoracaceae bacterium]
MFPFKRLTLIVLFSSMLLSTAWASCADLVLPPPRNTATQNIAAAANQASQEALKDELHKALRFAATANTYPGSTKEGKAYLAFLRQNQTFILQHLGRAFWEARRDAFDDLHGPLARKTVAPIAPEIEQWFDEVIVTKYAPFIFRKTNLWQERLQKSAPKQGLEPSDLGKDVNHYFTSFVRWQRDKAKLGQYLHFTPASPASRGAFSLSSSLEGAVKTGLVWQRFNMIYAPLLEDHYPLLFQSMAQQRKLFAQQNSFHDLAALFNKIINSSYDLYVWAKHNGGIYVHRDAESNRFWLNDQKAAALDPAEYVERLPQIYNLYLQRLGELLQQNGLPFVYEGPENIAQHFTNRPGETIAEQALINNGTGRLVMDVAYDHPIIRPTEDEPGVHFLSNRFNIDPASITHPDLRPLKYLIDHVTQLMRDISVMAVRHLQIEIGNLDYPITRNAIAGKYLTYATTTLGLAHTHGKERRISIDALAIFQHPYTTIGTVAHELQHLAEGQNDYLFFLEAPEGFLHIDDGYKTKFRIDEASARLAQAKLLIELLQKERKASTFAPAATAAGPTSSLTDAFLAHTPQATLLAEQQGNLQQLPHSILDYLKQADRFNFVGRHIL